MFSKIQNYKTNTIGITKKECCNCNTKNIRCHINRKEYLAKKKEIHIETCKKSSIIIQKNIRRHISRKQYLAKKKKSTMKYAKNRPSLFKKIFVVILVVNNI